jgi:hypothetical protein
MKNSSDSVFVIRLISGEEIIATVLGDDMEVQDGFILKDIAQIIMPEPGRIGLMDFMSYAEKNNVFLRESSITFMLRPVNELLQNYQRMFGNIVTPEKRIIL